MSIEKNIAAGNIIGEVRDEDVLLGRGKHTTLHPGNKHFREMAKAIRPEYKAARDRDKRGIATRFVADVRRNNVRFLKWDENTGNYREVDESKAINKTQQLLRERPRRGVMPQATEVHSEEQQQLTRANVLQVEQEDEEADEEAEEEVQNGQKGEVKVVQNGQKGEVKVVQNGQEEVDDQYDFDKLKEKKIAPEFLKYYYYSSLDLSNID